MTSLNERISECLGHSDDDTIKKVDTVLQEYRIKFEREENRRREFRTIQFVITSLILVLVSITAGTFEISVIDDSNIFQLTILYLFFVYLGIFFYFSSLVFKTRSYSEPTIELDEDYSAIETKESLINKYKEDLKTNRNKNDRLSNYNYISFLFGFLGLINIYAVYLIANLPHLIIYLVVQFFIIFIFYLIIVKE